MLSANAEDDGRKELKELTKALKKRTVSDSDFVMKLTALAGGAGKILAALLSASKADIDFIRSPAFDADDIILSCVEAGRLAKSDIGDFSPSGGANGDALYASAVAAHDIILLTISDRSTKIKWNKFCRNFKVRTPPARLETTPVPSPIGFISVDMRGLAGSAFVDFGPGFSCRDANGEAEVTRVVKSIDGDVVTLDVAHVNNEAHGINVESEEEGWIKFVGVQGMVNKLTGVSINESGAWRAKVVERVIKRMKKGKDGTETEETAVQTNQTAVRIGDTSEFSPYLGGGTVTSVKQAFSLPFVSYEDALLSGGPRGSTWDNMETSRMDADWQIMNRPQTLHIAFIAIAEYEAKHDGNLPAANDEAAADEVVEIAIAHNNALKQAAATLGGPSGILFADELDVAVVKTLAMMAATEIQPVACFFGGVIAQEVVKYTGKFTPISQFCHFEALACLPVERPPAADLAPKSSRFDHQIAVFGRAFQAKLAASSTFMVGCGALGCEYLKNFALVGIAHGEGGGTLTVTDNDAVSVSNLNRQFLFRSDNVDEAKSIAASRRVLAMNPFLNVKAMKELVCVKTENVFNDEFWGSLDWVTNALDNMKARMYVDDRCVFYEKALMESGTLSTKCNSVVVLPHKTQSYSDGPQAGENEDQIPMCTLRNFPSLIEHCIEWARSKFNDLFVDAFQQANKYTANPAAFLAELRADAAGKGGSSKVAKVLPTLRQIAKVCTAYASKDFGICVAMAHDTFYEFFNHLIARLVNQFPRDFVNKDTAEPFWSGSKRFPTAMECDLGDEMHLNFVRSAANIFAANLTLVPNPDESKNLLPAEAAWRTKAAVEEALAGKAPPPLVLGSAKIATEGDAEDEGGDDELAEFNSILGLLSECAEAMNGVEFACADFEKDQDMNFHIDFITAASNLRARNYQLEEATRHKCKMIAGKIIPAIATATAAITGLMMLEMFKLVQDKPLEAFRNAYCNLGFGDMLCTLEEPKKPDEAKDEYDPIEMEDVVCYPPAFTKWHKLVVDVGAGTLADAAALLKQEHGLTITSLSHAACGIEDGKGTGQSIWAAFVFGSAELKAATAARWDMTVRAPPLFLLQEASVPASFPFLPLSISRVRVLYRFSLSLSHPLSISISPLSTHAHRSPSMPSSTRTARRRLLKDGSGSSLTSAWRMTTRRP